MEESIPKRKRGSHVSRGQRSRENRSERKTASGGKKGLRTFLSGSLSLPEDMLLDAPRITLNGNHELEIENYKNVLEYAESSIQLNCTDYILRIGGKDLEIISITDELIHIRGVILSVSFTQ